MRTKRGLSGKEDDLLGIRGWYRSGHILVTICEAVVRHILIMP